MNLISPCVALCKLTEEDICIGCKRTIEEIINVLTPAIKGGGNDVDATKVKQMIWKGGLVNGMRCAGEILTTALNSGLDNEGNEEAEKKSETQTGED